MKRLMKHPDILLQAAVSLIALVLFWDVLEVAIFHRPIEWEQSLFYALRAVVLFAVMLIHTGRMVEREGHLSEHLNMRFRKIAEVMPSGLLGINSTGTIIYSNPAAQRMLGRTDMEGCPVESLIPPRFHNAHHTGWVRYMATGESRILNKNVQLPFVCRSESGRTYECPLVMHVIPVPNGMPQLFAILREPLTALTPLEIDVDFYKPREA